MAEIDPHAIALEIKAAQDACSPLAPFTARHASFDLPAAYDVARRVHRMRLDEGWKAVGRKVGFTNPDMWEVYGVRAPMWGHVYDTTLTMAGSARISSSLRGLADPKIEPEIAFRFSRSPRPGDSIEDLLASIDQVACAFEIVQSHYPGWKFQAPDTIADGGLHGRLFVGPAVAPAALGPDPLAALESFELTLSRNGERSESGRGRNVLGSPIRAIEHLVLVLAQQGDAEPLHAGEWVTTGTITAAKSIRPGETWRSEVAGIALSGLDVTFTV